MKALNNRVVLGSGILGSRVQADLCVPTSVYVSPDSVFSKAPEVVESKNVKRSREERDVKEEEEEEEVEAAEENENTSWSSRSKSGLKGFGDGEFIAMPEEEDGEKSCSFILVLGPHILFSYNSSSLKNLF